MILRLLGRYKKSRQIKRNETGFSSLTLTVSSPKEQKSKEEKKGKSPVSVPILCDDLFNRKLLVFGREEEETTKAEELQKLGRKHQNSASCARLGPGAGGCGRVLSGRRTWRLSASCDERLEKKGASQ